VLRRTGATDANASTSPDRTAYHEVVPANELELALWLEADRMGYFLPGFGADRLAAQQAVVRAERRQRYENTPYGAERLALARALYPDGHPLRHLTIGTHDAIQAATVADVTAFYQTWYVPANAILVVAGDVADDVLDAAVDRYFGSFPASRRPLRAEPPAPDVAPVVETVEDPFTAIRRIHRVWLGPRAFAADEPELDLLTAVWGATGTGPLWRRLVYDAPLAQRVSTWTTNGRLGGELHISIDLRTGADPDAIRAVLDDEHARACTVPLPELAIARAVTRREASAIWSLTSLTSRASTLARYAAYTDEPDGLAGDLARYRAITPQAIVAAAARWLAREHMVEIVTLPIA
jgi:zinc protease